MFERPKWSEKVYNMPTELASERAREEMYEFMVTLHRLPAKLQPEVMYAYSKEGESESMAGVS